MIFDILAALAIMLCLVSLSFSIFNPNIQTKETLVGIIAFQTELKSKAERKNHHILIYNRHLNNEHQVPFEDCFLRFTDNGTASLAGTCIGEKSNLTLRPGEGGIGYPW